MGVWLRALCFRVSRPRLPVVGFEFSPPILARRQPIYGRRELRKQRRRWRRRRRRRIEEPHKLNQGAGGMICQQRRTTMTCRDLSDGAAAAAVASEAQAAAQQVKRLMMMILKEWPTERGISFSALFVLRPPISGSNSASVQWSACLIRANLALPKRERG